MPTDASGSSPPGRRHSLLARIPQMTLGALPKWKSTKFPPDVLAEWKAMREGRKTPYGILALTQTTVDVALDFEESWSIIDVTTKFDEEHRAYYKSYWQDWETLDDMITRVIDDCRTYLASTWDCEVEQKKDELEIMWTRLKVQYETLQPTFDMFRKKGML
ncbi:uncharacterized protein J7T54_000205 [Emericellopsis cladophorae]|uniref:Uncharacterized protein n=1 Tax=Emericellopsis cladophorae TaxID=2686198 RepID=A0A9P9XZJ2_9HYPO|nr:uncharacterized protein J7T54_000205 [Emericellopsis cladophorae]KAI6780565.1 hypothetical protein J7T54_000205 [Emericellopsis cladophorae]